MLQLLLSHLLYVSFTNTLIRELQNYNKITQKLLRQNLIDADCYHWQQTKLDSPIAHSSVHRSLRVPKDIQEHVPKLLGSSQDWCTYATSTEQSNLSHLQISSCLGWKGQKRTSGFLENKLLFGSVFLYYSVYQTMVRKRRVTILPQSAEMCYHYKEVQRCDGKHTTSYSPTWGHLMVNYEWMNINLPAQLSSFLFVVTV